ncbi:MAG: type II toxin-antitoxin system VapC family toxin [Rhodospirillales bacterium]
MTSAVLDASAILAYLKAEPGGDAVKAHLPGATASAVNVAEVGAKLADRGMSERDMRTVIGDLGLNIVAFDQDSAYAAAALRGRTRRLGLSLGDRACLALGADRGLPVLTADRGWAGLDLDIEIRLIRSA